MTLHYKDKMIKLSWKIWSTVSICSTCTAILFSFFMFNVKFYYWISCDFIVKCDFYLLIEELVNLNIEDFYVYVLNFIAKVLLLSVTGIKCFYDDVFLKIRFVSVLIKMSVLWVLWCLSVKLICTVNSSKIWSSQYLQTLIW